MQDIVKRPTVLVGNSVGSLACVIAAASGDDQNANLFMVLGAGGDQAILRFFFLPPADSSKNLVRALVLFELPRWHEQQGYSLQSMIGYFLGWILFLLHDRRILHWQCG